VQAETKKYKNKIQFINLNSSFYNLTNYKAIYLFRTNSQVIKTYKINKIHCNPRQTIKMIHRTL